MTTYNVLIMGASYGSLLATKLLFGGHKITMVCLPAEVEAFNNDGARVRLPIRGRKEPIELELAEIAGQACRPPAPATSTRGTTISSRWRCRSRNTAPRAFANCSTRWRGRKVPCMSIMNMPPLPYLKRIPGLHDRRAEARLYRCRACGTISSRGS